MIHLAYVMVMDCSLITAPEHLVPSDRAHLSFMTSVSQCCVSCALHCVCTHCALVYRPVVNADFDTIATEREEDIAGKHKL